MFTVYTLCARLRWARTMAGMTMRHLAAVAGVGDSYPRVIEQDRVSNPGIESLTRLADALDVPFIWLAKGWGKTPSVGALQRRGDVLRAQQEAS